MENWRIGGLVAHHWRSMLGWIRAAAELLTFISTPEFTVPGRPNTTSEIQPREDSTTRDWVVMGQWLTVSRVSTVQIDHC